MMKGKNSLRVGEIAGEGIYVSRNPDGEEVLSSLTPKEARFLAQRLMRCADLVEEQEDRKQRRRPDPREYMVVIHWVPEEDGDGYYCAYSPDFGHSSCSATEATEEEVVQNIRANIRYMMNYYEDSGRALPVPSYFNFDMGQIVKGERPELKKRREDAD
jgi:predicted RNase H-like HicB family nuclease